MSIAGGRKAELPLGRWDQTLSTVRTGCASRLEAQESMPAQAGEGRVLAGGRPFRRSRTRPEAVIATSFTTRNTEQRQV